MTKLPENALRLLKYLSFKMDMLREQEEFPLHLDVEKAQENYNKLCELRDERVEQLVRVMPKIPVMKSKTMPKNFHNKDGSLNSYARGWYAFLEEQGLPRDTVGPVNYVVGYKDSKPTYHADVKEWLYSLGWKPCTFSFKRKDDGTVNQIPQIKYPKSHDRAGELCDSVMTLTSKEPNIELLAGLSVIQHRISLLMGKGEDSGFLNNHKEGKLVASAGGLTNTLRMQHRAPIANLPSVDSDYGEMIRGVLIPPEGKIFCGADVVSLEDTLKQHFIYPHDPEFVEEMNKDEFDPHLNLALFAGVVSQDQYDLYGDKERNKGDDVASEIKLLKGVRKNYKTVNYAAQYGVQKVTLARQSGLSEREAQKLLDAYWARNWSIKAVAKEQYVKTLPDGSMWLKNPINGFYYSLRSEKDIFSTLVQGSGDYIFCLWTMFCRSLGLKISLNYHDEWLAYIDPEQKGWVTNVAEEAMRKVNSTLNLNKEIKMDIQFGQSYAECH